MTDKNDKTYTLNQQQIAYLIRTRDTMTMSTGAVTFMLKTQDIPGYPDGVSMKKVEVILPGLAKGYYCAPNTIVSGTRNHQPVGAYGKVVGSSENTITTKLTVTSKSSTVTDTSTVIINDSVDKGRYRTSDVPDAQIHVNGVQTNNCSPGGVFVLTAELQPRSLVIEPALYVLEPTDMTLQNEEFSLRNYQVDNIPLTFTKTKVKDVTGGTFYKYTFPTGTVIGSYDSEYRTNYLKLSIELAVSPSAEIKSYALTDMLFLTSNLKPIHFGLGSNVADTYDINSGYPLAMLFDSGSLNVVEQKELTITSSIKRADEETWYNYDPADPNTVAILSQGVGGQVRLNIRNGLDFAVDDVKVYVPIPRLGQNYGAAFGNSRGGFDVYLSRALETLPEGWSVRYGTGAVSGDGNSELQNVTWHDDTSGLDLQIVTVLELSKAQLAGKVSAEIVLNVTATDDSSQANGTNLMKTWYTYQHESQTIYDGSTRNNIGMKLQEGVLNGTIFLDANKNGVMDDGESGLEGVRIQVTDESGREYNGTTGAGGTYEIRQLPTNQNLTITVYNPKSNNPNAPEGAYRFSAYTPSTESQVGCDVTSSDQGVTASVSNFGLGGAGTRSMNAGLMEPYTLTLVTDEHSQIGGNLSAVKVFKGQTLTDVLGADGLVVIVDEGYALRGWTKASDGSEVIHSNLIATPVTGDETYTVVTEKTKATATYEQASGKTTTKNNDPLLVIGTVTGNDEVPKGDVFFMFSGDLTGSGVNLDNPTEVDRYAATITRVMDSSEAWTEEKAKDPSTYFNGYAGLIPADITFADEESYKSEGKFVRIPAELLDLPVRIAIGNDITTYYNDSALGNFTPENAVPDASSAKYKVVRTYEYTTLKNGGSTAVTLGELLDDNCKYGGTMTYSDVEVYEKQLDGTWKSITTDNGYTTDNVKDPQAGVSYEADFSNIKQEILNRLNGSDSGKFWNKANSSFGLAITYEYISDNICLTKYVPDDSQTAIYDITNSPAQAFQPTERTHNITAQVYYRDKGQGDEAWQPLSPMGDTYTINYNQELRFVATDSDATVSGQWAYAVNPEGGLPGTMTAGFENDAKEQTASWVYSQDSEAGTTGTVTVYLIRESDGTFDTVNTSLKVQVNPKTNAETPVLTMNPKKVTQFFATSGKPTLTVDARVSDGGTLSYQWYKSDTKLSGEQLDDLEGNGATKIASATSESYQVTRPDSQNADTTVYYYVKVTNTKTGASGTATATAVGEAPVQWLIHTAPQKPTLSDASYNVGAAATALNAAVEPVEGDTTITYQWYSSTDPDADFESYNSIGSAKDATYTPPTNSAGTTYYYVKITSTRTVDGVSHAVTVDSDRVTITVGVETFTLTFNANGGKNPPSEKTYSKGATAYLGTVTAPTHDPEDETAVVFVGWSADRDTTIYAFDSETDPDLITEIVMNQHEEVFAVWSYDTNNNGIPDVNEKGSVYTLTYQATGNTGTTPSAVKALPGTVIELDEGGNMSHAADGTGKIVFAGWSENSGDDGKILSSGDSTAMLRTQVTMPTSNKTVYAVWGYSLNGDDVADALQTGHSLTYDANTGYNEPTDSNKYVNGQKVTLNTSNPPSHTDADGAKVVFIGWTATRDTKIYEANDREPTTIPEVTFADADIRVYAVWGYDRNNNSQADVTEDDQKVTLSYNENAIDGAVDGMPTGNTYVVGQEVTLSTEKPTHDSVSGKTVLFVGWTETQNSKIYTSADSDTMPETKDKVTMVAGGNTVYAAWGYDENNNTIPDVLEKGKFDLIYNANGGDGSVPTDSFKYSMNGTATLQDKGNLTHAPQDGKDVVWMGWSRTRYGVLTANDQEPTIDNQVTFTNNNITVYAVWGLDTDGNGTPDVKEPIKYTLTYDSSGGIGTVTDSNKYVSGSTATLVGKDVAQKQVSHNDVNGVKVVLIGWTLTDQQDKVLTANDTLPALKASVSFTDRSITVYAVWGLDTDGNGTADIQEAGKYTLTYDPNGGSGEPTDSNKYVSKQTVTLSDSKPSHAEADEKKVVFIGWSTEDTNEKIWDSTVDNAQEVQAKIKADVTFEDNDITVYALWGYDTNGNEIADILEGAQYRLTYNVNGGIGSVTDSKLYKAGDEVELDKGTGLTHDDASNGKTVLFYGWSRSLHVDILTANDTVPSDMADKVSFSNGNIEVFAVWAESSDGNTPDIDGDKRTLTYDSNGGVGTVTDTKAYVDGNTVTLLDKKGIQGSLAHLPVGGVPVEFVGWTSDKAYTTIYEAKDTLPGTIVTEVEFNGADITVYAVWGYDRNGDGKPDVQEPEGSKYDLIYDQNAIEGTVSGMPTDSNKYVVNQKVTLSTQEPTHEDVGGKRVLFIGWTESQNSTIYASGESAPTVATEITFGAGDKTVYAAWGYDENKNDFPDVLEKGQFTLTYNANTGSNPPTDSFKYSAGATATLAGQGSMTHDPVGEIPVLFIGWSLTQCGVLTANDSKPDIVTEVSFSNGNIVVYAVWGLDTDKDNTTPDVDETKYTLTYDPNGGVGSVTDGNKYVNGSVATLKTKDEVTNLLSHPDQDGAEVLFMGWSKTKYDVLTANDSMPGDIIPTLTFGEGNETVYAVWGLDANGNKTPDVDEGEDNKFSITYRDNAQGGTVSGMPTDTNKYVPRQTVILSKDVPTHTEVGGKKILFVGWSTTQLDKVYSGTDNLDELNRQMSTEVVITANTDVYAVWGYDTNNNDIPDVLEGAQFKLTYNINGGNVAAPTDSTMYKSGDEVTLKDGTGLTHSNAANGKKVVFIGWSLTKYGVLTANDPAPSVTDKVSFSNSNIEVFAVWGESTNGTDPDVNAGKYTLTYDVNDGIGSVTDNNQYVAGSNVVLKTKGEVANLISHADQDGAKVAFIGWTATKNTKIYEAKDSKPAVLTDVDFVDSDITVYAVWGYDRNNDGDADVEKPDDSKYTLTYNENAQGGGTVSNMPTDSNKYVVNQKVTLSDQVPTHTDVGGTKVVFIGWSETQLNKIYSGTDDWAALEADLTNNVTFTDSSINVYAVWGYDSDGGGIPDIMEGAQFRLTYHINGGDVAAPTDSTMYKSGDEATLVTEDDYTLTHGDTADGKAVVFIGWSLTKYDVLTANDAAPVTLTKVAFSNDDITVYAVWGVDTNGDGTGDVEQPDGNKYTLTYNVNGGTGVVADNNQYVEGSVATLRTKDQLKGVIGHASVGGAKVVFIGWTADQDTKIYEAKDQMPAVIPEVTFGTEDETVYAVWGYDRNGNGTADVEETDKFDLIYDANGGEAGSVPTDSNKYVVNQVATLDTATVPTHADDNGTKVLFVGWSETDSQPIYSGDDDADAVQDLLTDTVTFVDSDITVYAVWGYDTDGNNIPDISEGAQFSLTYDVTSGSGSVTDSTMYKSGDEVTLKDGTGLSHDPTADGKTIIFIGWSLTEYPDVFTANDEKPERINKVTFSTKDITVYAVWGVDTNDDGTADVDDGGKYELIYDPNGGIGGPSDANRYVDGDKVTLKSDPGDLPTHAKDGKYQVAFIGWTLDPRDTTIYAAGQEAQLPQRVTEVTFDGDNITVYALWGYDRNENGVPDVLESGKYYLTYDANAQEGGSVENLPADTATYVWNDTATLVDGSGMTHTDVNDTAVVFAGWTEQPVNKILSDSDTAPSYIGEVTFNDTDLTVYAAWGYDTNGNGDADVNENATRHSLTYVITGAAADAVAPATNNYLSGTEVTLADGSGLAYGDPDAKVVFAGWTLDAAYEGAVLVSGDRTFMLTTTVVIPTRNVVVYAVWGEDADGDGTADVLQEGYSLTYYANGGYANNLPVDTNKYAADDRVTLADGSAMTHRAEGHRVIFAGWSLNQYDKIFAAGEGSQVRIITAVTFGAEDVKVYAVWGYDVNNNGVPDMDEADYGLTYDANGGQQDTAPVDGNRYVKDQQVTLEDGSTMVYAAPTTPDEPGTDEPGTEPGTEPEPEPEPAVLFVGWSRDPVDHVLEGNDDDRQILADSAINTVTFSVNNITVYAIWGYDRNDNGVADVTEDPDGNLLTCQLFYNANGGDDASVPAAGTYESGETVTLDTATKPTHDPVNGVGVAFAGWTLTPYDIIYTVDDVLPDRCEEVTFLTSDITVYAVWAVDKNGDGIPDVDQSLAFLTYDVNGGDPDSISAPGKYLPGDVVQLTEVPRHDPADYYGTPVDVLFLGWSLDKVDILRAGDTPPVLETEVAYNADGVTVYAVWAFDYDGDGSPDYPLTPVTLTYEPNGGDGAAVVEIYPANNPVAIKSSVFTRASHRFLSWNTMADGSGDEYTGGTVVTLTADLTVYAQWSYNGGGGGGGGSNKDESFTITIKPIENGTISPSGKVPVEAGDDLTVTITPDEGYHISDVLVDGESVGPVDEITLEDIDGDHTIEVIIAEGDAPAVLDPDQTGVSDWLVTDDHIQYLQGKPGSLFGPSDNMTRAEVAQMFYNLLLNKDVAVTTSFSDVAEDAWYAEAVNVLASMGILKGTGGGKFDPLRTITRAEFTTIAMRFANLDVTGENIFTDVAEDAWYYDYIIGSIKYGWINGYGDGTFRPENTITRAEVTIITNRMLGRSADKAYVDSNMDSLKQFVDLDTSNYAYYDIMEATNAHDFTKEEGVESWTGLNQ